MTGLLFALTGAITWAEPIAATTQERPPESSASVRTQAKQYLVFAERNLLIENKQVRPGVTMMDEIARCAALSKTSGELVTCIRHVTDLWKKQGLISGSEKSRIIAAATRSENPAAIAAAYQVNKPVVASVAF